VQLSDRMHGAIYVTYVVASICRRGVACRRGVKPICAASARIA
jgi:hypothetical protein